MPRLNNILAFGIIACACFVPSLLPQTQTPVAAMSRFTDASFAVSFCYPSAWKVIEQPVTDANRGGWFAGAKIVKQLEIRNPAAADDKDQPPGILVDELLAPSGLTELGQSHSASPVGIDQKYFFDTKTRHWMYAQLSTAPNGSPPATQPATITQNTWAGCPY